jgi:hypothetical protein
MSDWLIGQLFNLVVFGLGLAYMYRRIEQGHRQRMAEFKQWADESEARFEARRVQYEAERKVAEEAHERFMAELQERMAREAAEFEREFAAK